METTKSIQTITPEFLSGGGETGRHIRGYNWSQTALGDPQTWPQSLRTSVSICLSSNFPICIYWGLRHVLIYNDAWSSIPGRKHPWALGKTGIEVWPEIWADIEPWFDTAFKGEPVGANDQLLFMERHGYPEECFFDFTFTPIHGDSGKVEGVFNAVIETTYRVINERRNRLLQELNKKIIITQSVKELGENAAAVLKTAKHDLPFFALYLVENNTATLWAADFTPQESQRQFHIPTIPVPDSLEAQVHELLEGRTTLLLTDVQKLLTNLPNGFWPEPTTEALLVPMFSSSGKMSGFLLAGISPRREMDEAYQGFFENAAAVLSNELNNIVSLEAERKRAAALAEIDRAKTVFFSNISHEFRTPLTLMLSPLEDALNDATTLPHNYVRMDLAYRNGLRLQKLVNTLLEFSRLEAGRMEGRFTALDICSFTQDLASSFRSAIEKAEMELVFDCRKIAGEVYVDKDMWEKIVLNLISNAFKYSTHGTIEVGIRQAGKQLLLTVKDTGIGIPAGQLDKIFDRFHRIENRGGRSQEGTGIGLAIVKELVKLHGGSIAVESTPGQGSIFTVSIPVGKAHLPQAQVYEATAGAAPSGQSEAFIQEALKWVPGEAPQNGNGVNSYDKPQPVTAQVSGKKYKVVLADDNTDMRDYITRLLSPGFEVLTATNGEEALAKAIEHKPHLILTDVMMPKLDGVGLLKEVRKTPALQNTPVIFLSARAGEEAKVEGLEAGADDYLVKPFSAKELLARVEAQITRRQHRDKALNDLYNLFNEVPFAVAVLMGESLRIDFVNQYNLGIWQHTKEEVLGKPLFDVFPGNRATAEPVHREVYRTGRRFTANELPVELTVGGKPETRWFNVVIDPLRDENGQVIGQLSTTIEVTESVRARKKIEESEAVLNEMANAMPQLVWIADAVGNVEYYNNRLAEFAGARKDEKGQWHWEGLVHPDDLVRTNTTWEEAIKTGGIYQAEHRIQMRDGRYRWFLSRGVPQKDEAGAVAKWFGTATDIHDNKTAEENLRKSESYFRQLTDTVPTIIWITQPDGFCAYLNKHWYDYTGQTKEEAEGFGWLHATHPDDKEEAGRIFLAANAEQKPFNILYRLRNKHGEYRWAIDSGSPKYSADGVFEGMIGTVVDVHEQKLAEEKIRQSESRYRKIFEGIPVSVWEEDFSVVKQHIEQLKADGVADIKGYFRKNNGVLQHLVRSVVVRDVNEVTLRLLQAAGKEEITAGLQQIFIEDTSEAFIAELETIAAGGGSFTYETTVQTLRGLPLQVLVSIDFPTGGDYSQVIVSLVNITERKQAEASLVYRKALLEAQNEAIPDAILIVDTRGGIILYNRHFATLWKIPQAIVDARDDTAALTVAVTQVADPQGFINRVNYCYAHPGEPAHEEVLFADGRIIERYGNAVVGDDGKNYGYIWYFRDITERKKSEEAIRSSEDRYQNFVRRSSEGIWRFEVEVPVPVHLSAAAQINHFFAHAYLAECNDAMAQMYGYQNSGELIGMRLANFFPRDADSEAYFTYFIASGYRVQDAESKEQTKTGETKYFSNNLIGIVEDGFLLRAWGTQRDITAQREAEEKIRESEGRFRTLAETLPQMIWVTDGEGRNEYASSKWEEYSGISNAYEAWAAMVHPDERVALDNMYAQAFASGQPFKAEARLKNKEGEYRWHSSIAEPVKDADGKVIKWIGAISDIHDQKTLAQRLEGLVAERTRQLQQSNEDLQQFAHVASHDLKEPVRKVKTFISRLEDEMDSRLDERSKLYISKIQSATDRMFTMIDGVLTYSTINAVEQAPQKVDLNEVLKAIVTDIEVAIQRTGATVQYHRLPVLEGAPVLLYQLFYNLINNSIKFVKTEVPPVVSIRSEVIRKADREFAKIILQDNGIGFSPEQATMIFDTFTRLNSKDKYEGTGLGLALCKKIAERHGGSIKAEGQPGQGAVFTILLPLEQNGSNI